MSARRPAPAHLSTQAQNEWHKVVNAMPPDWFTPETESTFERYCECVAEAAELQSMIEMIRPSILDDDKSLKTYRQLLRDKGEQTRLLASLATKMRLLQQSTYNALNGQTAKDNTPGLPPPWESDQ